MPFSDLSNIAIPLLYTIFSLLCLMMTGILLAAGFVMFRRWNLNKSHQHSFSIVIAGRNEEASLPALFASLAHVDYPVEKMEIIFADDGSTDGTSAILKEWQQKLPMLHAETLSNATKTQPGKREALIRATARCRHDIILFTDADICVPRDWLASMNRYFTPGIAMVLGNVVREQTKGIQHLKGIISSATFCATACQGIPFSCSGGNLAIRRETFTAIGGYQGLGTFTSGDDKLLLQQVRRYGYQVAYNAETNVREQGKIQDTRMQMFRELRHFGKFRQSSPFYQLVTLFGIALLILYPPILVHALKCVFPRWEQISMLALLPALYCFFLLALLRQKQRPVWSDFILLPVYPYYVMVLTMIGMFTKVRWKT